jgi:hypothetical protein
VTAPPTGDRQDASTSLPLTLGGAFWRSGGEPSSDTPVVMLPGMWSGVAGQVLQACMPQAASSLNPRQSHAGGVFLFQPCSAEIDGGGTISSHDSCQSASRGTPEFMIQVPRQPHWRGISCSRSQTSRTDTRAGINRGAPIAILASGGKDGRRNHPLTRQLSCRAISMNDQTSVCASLSPHQSRAGGDFLFQPCSAADYNDGGIT